VVGSAENSGELERRADRLREQNAALAQGSQSALESLGTIEAHLAQTRAELASFRARAEQVQERRRAVYKDLRVVRSSLRTTRKALARRLQTLYEEGETDTLAVILGAGSLNGALDAMETLDQAAAQDRDLLAKAQASSRQLAGLNARLAGRQRELEQLAAARAAAAASLAAARASRLQSIAAIRAKTHANAAAIGGLQARARTLAAVEAAPPAAVPVPGAPRIMPGSGAYSLTVVATGYALRGNTSSGRPVGWGAVAVDPSLIPLGSRLSVPGYGIGVAADTGGAIQGARIDLWFPSVAQARAWGSRAVTITVYAN
jgi:3D (Asp-Asp-Asp) domain-containing protein/peptidoglycan hydrolase CwlO-like protein